LLAFVDEEERFPAPAWALGPRDAYRPFVEQGLVGRPLVEVLEQRRAIQRGEREKVLGLRHAWLDRLVHTRAPLRETLTLFWHGHWTTEARKVLLADALWSELELLRRHAAGNFAALARAMLREPALLVYLDNTLSTRDAPNENLARELLELYTLGVGHYTEEDVRAAARALTGWSVHPDRSEFRFDPAQHDDGEKTFLGRSGPFGGDEILSIVLEHPALAPFVVRKLWLFYAGTEPSAPLLAELASTFRASGLELAPVLRRLFLSVEFHGAAVRGTLVKGPVRGLVGFLRAGGHPLPGADFCQGLLAAQGELLFDPPGVKGWEGGRAWLTSSTLLARHNYAGLLLKGGELLGAAPRSAAGGKASEHAARLFDVLAESRPLATGDELLPRAVRRDRATVQEFLEWRLFRTRLPGDEQRELPPA